MIEELEEKIIKANEAYRLGSPIISDREYDTLMDELNEIDPDNQLLSKIGHKISDSRKKRLPIPMFSMNKIKSMDDINDWCRLKGISKNEVVIITPKFDGLSLCVDEYTSEAWTRGNGEYGQESNDHYKLISNQLYDGVEFDPFSGIPFSFTYGEVMMSKKVFIDKYSSDFANPRNLVAGLLNSKQATNPLSDCNYIKYGAIPLNLNQFKTKEDILIELNQNQKEQVNYFKCKLSELTEDILIELFHNWSNNYEIDGLIIEINDITLQEKLGRETSSNNPCWARAYKSQKFEQSADSEVISISWNISKQGFLKPILHIKPVKLDGVTVSNVTGNNARFVKDMGIGPGCVIKIVRSGMVIPKVVDVIKTVDFIEPTIDGVEIGWNEAGIELITLTETEDQKLKKIVAFFEILEADNVGEGIITLLYNNGYKTIEQILNLTTTDLESIDRFGKRKSKIVFDSIQKSVTNVSLSKLQHATGIFKGLGSKKLALLEDFVTKPTVEQVMSVEGFAEISAKTYVDSYNDFFTFIENLPITISEKVEVVKTGNDLEGKQFVFTGVRRKDLEEVIVSRGGVIGGSVSKNTTHLVMKEKGSGSSKETKAISLGVIIFTVEELEDLLK